MLRFNDSNLETVFKEKKLSYQKPILFVVMFFGLILGAISWIVNPFNIAIYQSISFFAIDLLLIISVFAVLRKKQNYSELLLICFVFLQMIAMLEITNPTKDQWNHVTYFLSGITVELSIVTLMIAKVSMIKVIGIVLIVNILYFIRYSNLSDNQSMKFYPMTYFILNTAMLSIITYIMEKKDRENFQEIKNYEDSLTSFKDLIKDVFPSAIIIVKKNSIVFKNSVANEIFKTNNDTEIWAALKKIKLCSKEEDSRTTIVLNGNSHKEVPLFANKDEHKPGKNGTSVSLKKFITSINDISLKSDQRFLHSFFATYVQGHEASQDQIENFEVKFTNIVWEREPALMIILSENLIMNKLQTLREQARYKDNLLANVSHDLRTPLNGIIGMVTSVMEQLNDNALKRSLKLALRSSHLLLFVINDILDYSQVTNGKLRLNIEVFSLLDVVKDISSLIKFQAKRKGLNFIIDNKLPEGNKALIRSDSNRVKQVLMNLLGNALKFTEKGFIKISLNESVKYGMFDKAFNIMVEDSGIGIKEQDQLYLFKLYSRVDDVKTNQFNKNGVGLGLAISQNLVKLLNKKIYGADIKVRSVYGEGSCFYFDLISCVDEQFIESNIQLQDDEEILQEQLGLLTINEIPRSMIPLQESARLLLSDKEGAINVLIVDDDQINILVALNFLKDKTKYKCLIANNGAEAVELIKVKAKENYYFSVILMDCNMPVMDGFEATQQINALISDMVIPEAIIIACTANASQSDYEQCFEKGMTDYISKPFSADALMNKIKYLMNKKRANLLSPQNES